MAKNFPDWVRHWYPEVRLGALLAVALSLAFPPFAVDSSPGASTFLGCHSLFTQEAGYISLSRLLLFWLLALATAAFVQLHGERCAIGLPRQEMFFGRRDGAPPLAGPTLLAVILAVPVWLFCLGLVLGRHRVLGLGDHLAYFACVAFQLVVLSRLLLWLSREQTNLLFGYLILCAASLAWDLRTSPAPETRVGGLVPLYAFVGFLLYRFDLRFVVAPRVATPGAAGPVTNPVTRPSEASVEGLTVPSGPPAGPLPPAPAQPSDSPPQPAGLEMQPAGVLEGPESAAPADMGFESEPMPDNQGTGQSDLPNLEPEAAPEPDPYDRYRPGR